VGTEPTLTAVVTTFLDQKGWSYVAMGDGSLVLRYDGQHASWRCRVFVDEKRAQVAYYSLFPAVVPAERRGAVVDFITRANVGLVIGNFEFDTNRGELRYKTSIDVEGDRLTPALLTHVVHANVLTMDRYLPGLLSVIQDGATPAEALRTIGA
jgi:hypothetical protein